MQEVWGYQPCLWKMILVGVGVVCSGGLLLLLLYWLPEWGVKGTCTPTSLRDAHTLLLRTTVGKYCNFFLPFSFLHSLISQLQIHTFIHRFTLTSLCDTFYYTINDKFSLKI